MCRHIPWIEPDDKIIYNEMKDYKNINDRIIAQLTKMVKDLSYLDKKRKKVF